MPIKSQIKISEADLKTIYKEDYALFADKIITKDKKSKNEISGLASFYTWSSRRSVSNSFFF